MHQLEWIYNKLQSLNASTLVQIIDELELISLLPKDDYYEMAIDIYGKAKDGYNISHKQKRVLVNIIGKPREDV